MAGVPRKPDRDRSMEFKGFLNDLKDWDDLLKDKDEKLKGHARQNKKPGNEYFKQKRFLEAIECYSRSIALSPTSVAFANRAMAYLKLRRFEEAENDCTEALNLDDRYVKAYSRRATARKELGKLKASLEDADFAVRLDPNTQELRKQYSEIKALYEKEVANRKSGALKEASKESQRADGLQVESKIIQDDYLISNRVHNAAASSHKSSVVKNERVQHKHELKASLHDVASRAASRAVASAAKNITSPKSAYEFEVSWRALSDDSAQAQLLKMIPPHTLPQIFKNALSAPILVDIIKCIGTFFKEDTESAISLLDNMVKVPRFDMIIMCLSAKDHSEVRQVWEEIFSTRDIPVAHTEALARLQPKYCFGEQQEKN
ncbi:uncharacterized protein LOC135629631 isoform X4 [Musa acuminata AAA Group]|uniref:uncharacterized protein LOC135629631 isoform X4 n=1 Tax=Musa acuminata AAA Group TaxID=214697 RepID=UPI0031CF0B35